MHKLGLKLWSINENYIGEAVRLFEENIYQYIELFVVPDSYDNYSDLWADLNIPYVIHAPHFDKGMNLAKKENLAKNMLLAEETLRFADRLKVDTIIYHPGIGGCIEETVRQLFKIYDSRIVVENKPYYGHNDVVCVGSSPAEIDYVITNINVGFCLDIGHAICYANSKGLNPVRCLEEFIQLEPIMYHLSDGLYTGVYDNHKHLGRGDYNIKEILSLLPDDCVITIETDKDLVNNLSDFEEDIKYLTDKKYK